MAEPDKQSVSWLILKYIGLFFCVFLFISLPITGVIGFLFLSPLWLSIVVNAMLIHIALTGFYQGSSRLRVFIPITVYALLQIGIAVTRATVVERAQAYEAGSHLFESIPPEADLVFENISDWGIVKSVALLPSKRRVFDKQYRLVVHEVSASESCFGSDAVRLRGARGSLGLSEKKDGSRYCVDKVDAIVGDVSVHLNEVYHRDYLGLEGRDNADYEISIIQGNRQRRNVGQFKSGYIGLPPFTIIFSAGCLPNLGSSGSVCGIDPFPSSVPVYFGSDRENQLRWSGEGTSQTRARALVKMLDGGLAP